MAEYFPILKVVKLNFTTVLLQTNIPASYHTSFSSFCTYSVWLVGDSFLFSLCCSGSLPNGGIQFAPQPVASIASLAQAQAAAAAVNAVSMSGLQTMPSNPAVAAATGFPAPITYLPPTGGNVTITLLTILILIYTVIQYLSLSICDSLCLTIRRGSGYCSVCVCD